MRMRTAPFLLFFALAACGDAKPTREFVPLPDSGFQPAPTPPFEAPESWEVVQLKSGVEFRQPEGFTFGLGGANLECNAQTPAADSAVFPKDVAMRWPLALMMRRGTVSRIAFANGFTIDSTDIAEHGGAAGADAPTIRRGDGWMLLSGKRVLFGATRYREDCQIIWAARGFEIDADTLGMVMSTVRFGATPVARDSTP